MIYQFIFKQRSTQPGTGIGVETRHESTRDKIIPRVEQLHNYPRSRVTRDSSSLVDVFRQRGLLGK